MKKIDEVDAGVVELPRRQYLRRGDVMRWLGVDGVLFSKLVEAGVVVPLYFEGRGYAFFRREEVLRAEREGRLFRPRASVEAPVKENKFQTRKREVKK